MLYVIIIGKLLIILYCLFIALKSGNAGNSLLLASTSNVQKGVIQYF